jgi:hypothetical protein
VGRWWEARAGDDGALGFLMALVYVALLKQHAAFEVG